MERHHRKAKTAANAGISLSVKRGNLRTKYVTHQDSDVSNKLESNRPPLRQLLTEKENKQQAKRKEQKGQERQAKIRQGEAERAKAAAAAAVPVAGPSSLNTTVTLPASLTANYQITPELVTKKGNNYDIGDVRSDDSTDDDTRPKKSIPTWARSVNLKVALNEQANKDIDTESLFPAEVFLREPDLNEIFKIKRDRFDKRTSSAIWKTPPSNYM
uniref:Inner centromere protein ARK-binding domain-containing protein n=1 Tax=Daphnia galeata TaxID=27404 RepID=A0A8J2RPW8_9CRUS|nr:unnamed protein product [Daphnia galeata]